MSCCKPYDAFKVFMINVLKCKVTCTLWRQGMALLNKNTCRCECITCSDSEFQCGNGQCLPLAAKCDGVIDCQEDELNCRKFCSFVFVNVDPPAYWLHTLLTPVHLAHTCTPCIQPYTLPSYSLLHIPTPYCRWTASSHSEGSTW